MAPRTRKTTAAPKKRAATRSPSPSAMSMSPGTSLYVGAVQDQLGDQTLMSLAEKGRSDKLGAGMVTLVEETKKTYKKMKKASKRSASPKRSPKKSASPKKKSPKAKKGGKMTVEEKKAKCTAEGKVMDPVTKRCRKPKTPKRKPETKQDCAVGKVWWPETQRCRAVKYLSAKDLCGEPCTASRGGLARLRNKKSCKCLVPGGAAAKKRGICPAGKTMYTGTYKQGTKRAGQTFTRCVKASGLTAKAMGVCPQGKMLVPWTGKVPDPERPGKTMTATGTRCVKDPNFKDCPRTKVLVMAQRRDSKTGTTKSVKRCVTEQTAQRRKYTIMASPSELAATISPNWVAPAPKPRKAKAPKKAAKKAAAPKRKAAAPKRKASRSPVAPRRSTRRRSTTSLIMSPGM